MQHTTRIKLIWVLLVASLAAISLTAQAQTCTQPLFQGYPSSCSTINLRWLNRDPASLIDHFEIYIGSQLRGTAPGNAISFSDPVGCGFGATYTIRQVMKSGATCQTVTTGNPPHTGPCSTCNGGGPGSGVSIVSSANFRSNVARGSLVSIFPDPGAFFTDRAEQASSIDLPLTLGGVSVETNGGLCQLVAVAPGQINLLLPASLPPGPAEVSLVVNTLRGSSSRFIGRPQINPNAPGIFTANATGEGVAASVWLVVSADGRQRYFPPGALPALVASDQVFLLLFGTGINENAAELRLTNGRVLPAQFVGETIFQGLQQLNFRFPLADIPRGEVGAVVRVFGASGFWETQGVTIK